MNYLGRVLWLVPLSVHVAYMMATIDHLPARLGKVASGGTPLCYFCIGWAIIIAAANIAFVLLYIRLPKLKDSILKVPNQSYWLSTQELKDELISRLRGICEASLLGLNIFFAAVYQMIYQTNAPRPVMRMEQSALMVLFMVMPLLVAIASIILTVRGLAKGKAE